MGMDSGLRTPENSRFCLKSSPKAIIAGKLWLAWEKGGKKSSEGEKQNERKNRLEMGIRKIKLHDYDLQEINVIFLNFLPFLVKETNVSLPKGNAY